METRRFAVRCADGAEGFAADVAGLLERECDAVFDALGYRCDCRIDVEIFPDLAEAIGAPIGLNGFGGNDRIQLNMPGIAADYDYMVRVSLHELVHVVYNRTAAMPGEKWFREGVAECLSGGPRPREQIERYLRQGIGLRPPPTLRDLDKGFGSADRDSKETAYAFSSDFVAYIVANYGAGSIKAIVGDGMDFGAALGVELPALYADYLGRLSAKYAE